MEEQRQYEERYSRQTLFAPIGLEGQKKLLQSKVLIVGMGALGTVSANHLVRAGVGHVRFVDRDYVEKSNLQRQTLFDEEDAEKALPKAVAAEQKLKRINSGIQIEGIVGDVSPTTIADFGHDVDLILDGTDNFQTRFLLNDYAFKHDIPFIYGGGVSSRGMQATFIPGQTPCMRCFIQEGSGTGETCDTTGVLGMVTEIVASYQATEAMKYLVGQTDAIRKSLLSLDLWQGTHQEVKWNQPKTGCPTCGKREYPALQVGEEDITSLCGRDTIQVKAQGEGKWDLGEWKHKLEKVGDVEETPFLLRAYIDSTTLVIFPDRRVLVQGTEDVSYAKAVYAKYIGM